jgi:hypothetical protein
MGDDGFIREFRWRNMAQNPVGDARIAWGRVTNKRVVNGEYLVDLEVGRTVFFMAEKSGGDIGGLHRCSPT